MWPTGPALSHPATPLLKEYAQHGCPVDCGPDWTREQIEQALTYGAHPSAKNKEAHACLIAKTQAKVAEGVAHMVKHKDLKHKLPP